MNRLPLLLVGGAQVGPFVQQQLHHLHQFNTETLQPPVLDGGINSGRVKELKTHLLKPALSCVVQGSSAGAVRHVQVAQMGQQRFGAAGGAVGSCHVQRRLPELVSCVCLCSAPQQQAYDPLFARKQ